jgi:hypothetical protein
MYPLLAAREWLNATARVIAQPTAVSARRRVGFATLAAIAIIIAAKMERMQTNQRKH